MPTVYLLITYNQLVGAQGWGLGRVNPNLTLTLKYSEMNNILHSLSHAVIRVNRLLPVRT
jgi:hypothetical protein